MPLSDLSHQAIDLQEAAIGGYRSLNVEKKHIKAFLKGFCPTAKGQFVYIFVG